MILQNIYILLNQNLLISYFFKYYFYDIDKYILIYKSNKILDDITETVNHLIEIGNIHKHIVNSLDNTYMITRGWFTILNYVHKINTYEYVITYPKVAGSKQGVRERPSLSTHEYFA